MHIVPCNTNTYYTSVRSKLFDIKGEYMCFQQVYIYIYVLVELINAEDYSQQSAQRTWEKADVSLIHLMKLG